MGPTSGSSSWVSEMMARCVHCTVQYENIYFNEYYTGRNIVNNTIILRTNKSSKRSVELFMEFYDIYFYFGKFLHKSGNFFLQKLLNLSRNVSFSG